MLYGLLLEAMNAQGEKQAALPAYRSAADEEESWCLGMEAWVSCETLCPSQRTHC